MGISFNAASLLNGNGINVSSVVSEIQAAQSGQLTVWQGDLTTLQTQATALTGINSDLSNLASAAQGLTGSNGAFTAVTATSSETAIVNATAQTGAATANYTVVVSSLASRPERCTPIEWRTRPLRFCLPSRPRRSQSADRRSGVARRSDIPITAGSNDTLTTLASSINSLSTTNNWGITASVITDAERRASGNL